VGTLPIKNNEELKRTNEIKMAIPLLNTIDIEGKDVTADALLTQRKIAEYLVKERQAHYHFTVKGNQHGVLEDVALWFQDRKKPDFIQSTPPDHGRIEIRKIWTTTELNNYLDFPCVGQAFAIDGNSSTKKVASALARWLTASPVERPSKPTQSVSST
jgi:predicted transposase YbfD/YdcC